MPLVEPVTIAALPANSDRRCGISLTSETILRSPTCKAMVFDFETGFCKSGVLKSDWSWLERGMAGRARFAMMITLRKRSGRYRPKADAAHGVQH
jgi:hypothetical protein